MADPSGERVPAAVRPRFEAVVALTDRFGAQHLDDEYAQLCRRLAAALARKRPSPLVQGRTDVWACAVVYAIGQVNFLFDASQTPHMSAAVLCQRFGVGQGTASAKAKVVRDALGIGPYDPRWCRPSQLDQNPLAWLIEVDGLIVDARHAPPEVQAEALRLGLIPRLPGAS